MDIGAQGKIFKTRVLLVFEDEKLEKEYNSHRESDAVQKNIIFSFITLGLTLFDIVFYLTSKIERKMLFGISVFVPLVISISTLIISFLQLYRVIARGFSEKVLPSINFFISGALFAFNLIHTTTVNSEFLLSVFQYSYQILLIFIHIETFLQSLISSVLGLITYWVYIEYIIEKASYKIFITYYAIFLISCMTVNYYRDFKSRVLFIIQKKQTDRNSLGNESLSFYQVINEVNFPLFVIDRKEGKVNFANKEMQKIVKLIRNEDSTNDLSIEGNEGKIKISSVKNNEKRLKVATTLKNKIGEKKRLNLIKVFWENKLNFDFKKENNGMKLVPDEKMSKEIENIVCNLACVNDELPDIKLQEYLKSTTNKMMNFEFSKFIQIINSSNSFPRSNIQLNLAPKPNKKISEEKLNSGEATTLNVINQSEFMPLKIESNNKLLKTGGREVEEVKNEYVFLGKSSIKGTVNNNFEVKEYCVYFKVGKYNDQIEFLFKDSPKLLSNDREQIINACKNLFLSKTSHEFKNPICNLLEIIAEITEEVKLEKNNLKSENNLNTSMSSLSDSEYYSSGNIQEKINNLKAVCEMMMLLVKDFTFFSNMCRGEDFEKVNNVKGKEFKSDEIAIEVGKSPKKGPMSSLGSSPMKQRLSIDIGRIGVGKSIKTGGSYGLNHLCRYKDILDEISNLFEIKAKTEKKENKISLVRKYQEDNNLPGGLECDSDVFKSLIFNILYQIYKLSYSGKIVINVTPCKSKKQLLFEFSISGVIRNLLIGSRSNIPAQEIKKPGQMVDINTRKMEEISEEQSSNPEEIGFKNAKIDRKESESAKKFPKDNLAGVCLGMDNFSDISFIDKLLSIQDPTERNKFIDEFNSNFSVIISQRYAQILGIKLNIQRNNDSETKIYFYIDSSSFEPSSEKIETLKVKKAQINLPINPSFTLGELSSRDKKLKIEPFQYDVDSKEIAEDTPVNVSQRRRSNTTKNIKKTTNIQNNYSNTINNTFKIELNNSELMKVNESFQSSSVSGRETKRTKKNEGALNFNYAYFLTVSNKVKEIFDRTELKTQENEEPSNPTTKFGISFPSFAEPSMLYKSMYQSNANSIPFKNYSTRIINRNSKLRSSLSLHSSSINLSFKNLQKLSNNNVNEQVFRVLLCDDEPLVRKTLTRFFNNISNENKQLNFDLQDGENGFECLNSIYQYYKEGKFFDILIIDETMPIIKGSQIISLLRTLIRDSNLKDIIIVSFTSYDSPEKREFLISQGADYVISKPIKYDDFKSFFTMELLNILDPKYKLDNM